MRYQRATISLPLPVNRPDHWTESAACASPDVEAVWFDGGLEGEAYADRRQRQERAIAVCRECPVTAECRDAMQYGDEGVRAGNVYGERASRGFPLPQLEQVSKRTGRPLQPITHGTPAGYRAHKRRGEKACDDCLIAARQEKRERLQRRKAS